MRNNDKPRYDAFWMALTKKYMKNKENIEKPEIKYIK